MQTHIDLVFGDGEYTFRLGLPQIVAIEDKCGPIGEVYARLIKGRYISAEKAIGMPSEAAFRYADLVEIVRQGLIGGAAGQCDGLPVAVTPMKANALIEAYVHGRPLSESWTIATAIMTALFEGYEPVDLAQKKSSTSGAEAGSPDGLTGGKSSQTVQ